MPIYTDKKASSVIASHRKNGWRITERKHDNGHACVTVVVMEKPGCVPAIFGYPEHVK